MELFSWEFLLFFLAAFFAIHLRLRKKRVRTTVPHRTIAIRGKRLSTPISIHTPLPCLLDDGRHFGEDYQEKREPELPHTKACRCNLWEFYDNSGDWFLEKRSAEPSAVSDLGELSAQKWRYYKYQLIANHRDASADRKREFLELSAYIEVDSGFKDTVSARIAPMRAGSGRHSCPESPR